MGIKRGETVEEQLNTDTLTIFAQMKKQIESVYHKVAGFNRAYDWSDYQQEAFLACREAVIKFTKFYLPKKNKPIHKALDLDNRMTVMQVKTYAFWYIQKKLQQLANVNEVEYEIYNKQKKYIQTLSNTDYRKRKKELENKGFIAQSVRITYAFSELATLQDNKVREYEPTVTESQNPEDILMSLMTNDEKSEHNLCFYETHEHSSDEEFSEIIRAIDDLIELAS